MKILITGAFGYSGKEIATQLLQRGEKLKTLTNSATKHNPFGSQIEIAPLCFDNKKELTKEMLGYDILINTYWVRFNHKRFTHNEAVTNTKTLFECAKEAGIKKIVHVSITNPNENSDLEYFKGKAILEKKLIESGLGYSIVRPAVLFGKGDILINNIVWMIRHFPIFGVFGKGDYKLQPIHITDFAKIIVKECYSGSNAIKNAIGPETFTYRELANKIMEILHISKSIISIYPLTGFLLGKIIRIVKKDITITREEIKGLMDNLLYVDDISLGKIRLSEWLERQSDTIGIYYANELSRRKQLNR